MTDQLVPNYATIDPVTGRVGANFSGDITARSLIDSATNGQVFNLGANGSLSLKGLVNALGVILPAGSAQQSPQQATDQIIWRESGGAFIAEVQGWSDPTGNDVGVRVVSQALNPSGQSYAIVAANPDPGAPPSEAAALQITQLARGAPGQPGGIGTGTEVSAFVGQFAAMVLDSAGKSSFLKIDTPNPPVNLKVAFGGATFTWGGASSLSNTQRFFNGFTNGPSGFVGGAQGSGLTYPYVCFTNWGTNFVDAVLVIPGGTPGAGATASGWILAWGS